MSAGWDDIRLFLAVAETGSLSAAAAALGCSQPTIGRRLKALEHDLGLTLHERHANRIVLTEAGRAIASEAGAMAAAAAGLDQAARALARAEPEPLRISATGSLAYFLALHQPELAAAAGGVAVTILASRDRVNLARREADVALRMRRLPEDGDLVARRVARVAHAVYAVSTGVAAVIGLPDPERRPSQAAWLEGWAAGRPVPLRLGDVALRHQAARQGIGATLLPCWLGDGDPALIRLVPPPRELQEDVYLLVRRDARGEARLDRLVRGLAALFRTRADALSG